MGVSRFPLQIFSVIEGGLKLYLSAKIVLLASSRLCVAKAGEQPGVASFAMTADRTNQSLLGLINGLVHVKAFLILVDRQGLGYVY